MVGPVGLPPPDESVQETYASKVTGRRNERMKLNVLDIFLERKDNTISYNLSKEELAKLVFKKMAIDPKFVLKVDTSGFGKIHVELTNNVNPESMTNLPAFDIRNGLRTKFYRPHHRKDTLVTINWLDIETPDSLVTHILSHFGKIKSNIQWVKIKAEENESLLAKMLNNILSGERQIWMEVDKPIPSYAIIDGRKVKIYHPGQRRTCARCQKTAENCPGNSNAKLCDERGGDKVKVDGVWKEMLANVGYIDWVGGKEIELDVTEDEQENSNNKNVNIGKTYPSCDGLILGNLPDDTSDDDIKKLFEKAVLNSSDGISIHPSGTIRSRLIQNIKTEHLDEIVKTTDKMSLKGNLIYCRPHVPATPPKLKDNEEENEIKVDDKPKESRTAKDDYDLKDANSKTSPKLAPVIPGLSEEARKKAVKSAEKK